MLAAIGLWYDDYNPNAMPAQSPVTQDLLDVLSFTGGPSNNDTTFRPCMPYLQSPWRGFIGPSYAALNPLPVTYERFTADKQGTSVLLRWKVSQQVNNDRFEVEHNVGGGAFTRIGTVAASTSTSDYELYHAAPSLDKTNQYRLKQFDKDGRFTYSPIRLVKFSGKNIFTLQPNPATDIVRVFTDKRSIFLHLYEASGRKVKSQLVTDAVTEVNIAALPKGVYVLVAEKDGVQLEARRIVKQ